MRRLFDSDVGKGVTPTKNSTMDAGNAKPLTMEEKLAHWRMQKRANRHQFNRGIAQPKQQRRSSKEGKAKKENIQPTFNVNADYKLGAAFQESRKFDVERRNSIGSKPRLSNAVKTKKVHKRSSICTQTVKINTSTASTQTDTNEHDRKVVLKYHCTVDDMKEEISCLKFSNEVLLQQVDETTRKLNRSQNQLLCLENDLQLFQEREKTQETNVETLKNTLTAGLEQAVLEIEKTRALLKKSEAENTALKQQLESIRIRQDAGSPECSTLGASMNKVNLKNSPSSEENSI